MVKIRIKIIILQFHAVSLTYNNANVLSNLLNTNINKLSYTSSSCKQCKDSGHTGIKQSRRQHDSLNNITQRPQSTSPGIVIAGLCQIINSPLCIGQIEASTCPPGQPPGHLTFLKIIVQIPPYRGQNAVQMPHTRVHSGDQMSSPRGHFTGT